MSQDLQARGKKLLKDNPALKNPDWLPVGAFPEMDALAERHKKLIADLTESAIKGGALREAFEKEDQARVEALANGTEPPQMTSAEDREFSLKEHKVQHDVLLRAQDEFLAEAIDTIQANEAEWMKDLNKVDAEAEEQRQKARRMVEEADLNVWQAKHLRRWLKRTAENRPNRHNPYKEPSRPAEQVRTTTRDLQAVRD